MCVSVYRHASAGLSIHVNTSKMPEGAGVCACVCYAALKKIGKLNEVTDVLEKKKKSPFKSSEGFKLNTPV